MIVPKVEPSLAAIAAHYDELDRFYREIWGEHVHHGLWLSGKESAADAARQLATVVIEQAAVRRGDAVCDVGCGYGGTARLLALDHGAVVTALTISPAQHAYALGLDPAATNPAYLLRDWIDNGLPPSSFDAVISIESSEHMADKPGFFAEVARVLKPGGRFVVCAWLAREAPRRWETRHLLEPICREGRLPGMGSADEYRTFLQDAGLLTLDFRDVSRQVKRTWPICAWRAARGLIRDPDYRRFFLHQRGPNRIFVITLFRIWLAYELGSMRYGIFTARKPTEDVGQID